jgi:hypothetical protein
MLLDTGDSDTRDEILINHGADLDVINNDGRTALMIACDKSNKSLAINLLAAGSPVLIEDKDGDTALSLCDENMEDVIVALKANFALDDNYAVWEIFYEKVFTNEEFSAKEKKELMPSLDPPKIFDHVKKAVLSLKGGYRSTHKRKNCSRKNVIKHKITRKYYRK